MAARLGFEERCVISAMIGSVSAVKIAEALGRHPSTVRREISRGGGRDTYRAEDAQAETEKRARRPKTLKLVADPALAESVNERLKMGWSPHAVAADLLNENLPVARRVCAETIYQASLGPRRWILFDEARSSVCDHLAGMQPEVARRFCDVALVKGARATAAVEGERFRGGTGGGHVVRNLPVSSLLGLRGTGGG